jgi:Lon protease-like protein
VSDAERATLRDQRHRLEALLTSILEGGEPPLPISMPDEDLVNALAQYLPLEPIERQALLETPGPRARCPSSSRTTR